MNCKSTISRRNREVQHSHPEAMMTSQKCIRSLLSRSKLPLTVLLSLTFSLACGSGSQGGYSDHQLPLLVGTYNYQNFPAALDDLAGLNFYSYDPDRAEHVASRVQASGYDVIAFEEVWTTGWLFGSDRESLVEAMNQHGYRELTPVISPPPSFSDTALSSYQECVELLGWISEELILACAATTIPAAVSSATADSGLVVFARSNIELVPFHLDQDREGALYGDTGNLSEGPEVLVEEYDVQGSGDGESFDRKSVAMIQVKIGERLDGQADVLQLAFTHLPTGEDNDKLSAITEAYAFIDDINARYNRPPLMLVGDLNIPGACEGQSRLADDAGPEDCGVCRRSLYDTTIGDGICSDGQLPSLSLVDEWDHMFPPDIPWRERDPGYTSGFDDASSGSTRIDYVLTNFRTSSYATGDRLLCVSQLQRANDLHWGEPDQLLPTGASFGGLEMLSDHVGLAAWISFDAEHCSPDLSEQIQAHDLPTDPSFVADPVDRGTLDDPGALVWYRVELEAGTYVLGAFDENTRDRISAEAYSARDMSTPLYSALNGAVSDFRRTQPINISVSDVTLNEVELLTFDVVEPGPYFIRVSGPDSNVPFDDWAYSARYDRDWVGAFSFFLERSPCTLDFPCNLPRANYAWEANDSNNSGTLPRDPTVPLVWRITPDQAFDGTSYRMIFSTDSIGCGEAANPAFVMHTLSDDTFKDVTDQATCAESEDGQEARWLHTVDGQPGREFLVELTIDTPAFNVGWSSELYILEPRQLLISDVGDNENGDFFNRCDDDMTLGMIADAPDVGVPLSSEALYFGEVCQDDRVSFSQASNFFSVLSGDAVQAGVFSFALPYHYDLFMGALEDDGIYDDAYRGCLTAQTSENEGMFEFTACQDGDFTLCPHNLTLNSQDFKMKLPDGDVEYWAIGRIGFSGESRHPRMITSDDEECPVEAGELDATAEPHETCATWSLDFDDTCTARPDMER